MNKKKLLHIFLLFLLFFSSHISFTRLQSAHANGVIVTAPENAQQKAAPKKKPSVKKQVQPTPPPIQEEKEVIVLPTPLDQALVLMEKRFFTRATALLEQIVEREPLNAHAWYALGRAYEARGFFPKAQKALRRSLEIDPSFNELSRFLEYPAEGDRQPLWDPKRPARIEEIPVAIDGFTIMPPSDSLVPPVSPVQQPIHYTPPPPPMQQKVHYAPPAPPVQQQVAYTPPAPPIHGEQQAPVHNSISPASGVPVRVMQPGTPPTLSPGLSTASPSPTLPSSGPLPSFPPLSPENAAPLYIPPAPYSPESIIASPDILTKGGKPIYTPPPPGAELPQ